MDVLGELAHVIFREVGRMWWFTLLGITAAALIALLLLSAYDADT